MFRRMILICVGIQLCLQTAQAAALYGICFGELSNAFLYDIDIVTGQASNPRDTGLKYATGIASAPNGSTYVLTNTASSSPHPRTLFKLNTTTGQATRIGSNQLTRIQEGDIACDPTSGILYGLSYATQTAQDPVRQLFTINTQTGAARFYGANIRGDLSGMTFDSSGRLFVLDTANSYLLRVDKTTGETLSSVGISLHLGAVAGMAVDYNTGHFYVADGNTNGTKMLYELDPETGDLRPIGPTGTPDGLAGLTFIPEPTSALLIAASVCITLTSRILRGKRT